MIVSQNIAGLTIGDKITAPAPFNVSWVKEIVTAEITGFRYYTSRNTGRTYIVGDYITSKGDTSFDAVEKLVPLKIRRRRAR